MTNYEKIMNDMTPEMYAEIILEGMFNPCLMCAYRDKTRCAFHCLDGIEKWLKQEAEDESV
jgi:hypothetical protein